MESCHRIVSPAPPLYVSDPLCSSKFTYPVEGDMVHGPRRREGEKLQLKNDKSLIYDEAGVQRWMTTTMKSSSTATKISAFFARTLK